MDKNVRLQEEIISLLSLHFGAETAKLYLDFFDKEDPKTLLSSARDLLSDLLGQRKTDQELSLICEKLEIDPYVL